MQQVVEILNVNQGKESPGDAGQLNLLEEGDHQKNIPEPTTDQPESNVASRSDQGPGKITEEEDNQVDATVILQSTDIHGNIDVVLADN